MGMRANGEFSNNAKMRRRAAARTGWLAVVHAVLMLAAYALATRAGADRFIDSDAEPERFIAAVDTLLVAIDEVTCAGTEPTRNATPEEYDMNSYLVETGGYG
jgi:hypothetical protein